MRRAERELARLRLRVATALSIPAVPSVTMPPPQEQASRRGQDDDTGMGDGGAADATMAAAAGLTTMMAEEGEGSVAASGYDYVVDEDGAVEV